MIMSHVQIPPPTTYDTTTNYEVQVPLIQLVVPLFCHYKILLFHYFVIVVQMLIS